MKTDGLEWLTAPGKGRVGYIAGGRYVTVRKESGAKHHFSIRHGGYGIQKAILERCQEVGVETIVILEERSSGSMYRLEMPLDLWVEKGVEDELRAEDGRQVFLDMAYYPDGELIRPGDVTRPKAKPWEKG